MMLTRLTLLALFPLATYSFTVPQATRRKTVLKAAAPSFNKGTQKWEYTSDTQKPSAGYDELGTLLRHGPTPWFNRVFKTDDYEQAVLKFMASEGCDRSKAQGNMDAYLDNPNDWAYNRLQAQKTGFEPDYTKLDTSSLVLTSVWGSFVLFLLANAAYSYATGQSFWLFLKPFLK